MEPTRGNAVVTRAGNARGGRYIDIPALDIDIVNFDGLGLWYDHRSLVTRTGTMDARDRVNGLPATIPGGVSLAATGNAADDLDFTFETGDAASAIIVPDYVLADSYWAMFVLKPVNDGANVVRSLFRQGASTGPYAWIVQASMGANYQVRLRHQGAALSGATADIALPANARNILWFAYDKDRLRMVIGVNKAVVATAASQEAHTGGTDFSIFGNAAFGADNHYVGGGTAALFGGGDFYSADASSPVNTRRNDFIELVAARYGITI